MGTQSKKIDETKAKDRKKGFQPIFQAVCFVLRFLLFFDPFFIFIASCLIIFFKFKHIVFEFNFYERNAFQCNRIRCGS